MTSEFFMECIENLWTSFFLSLKWASKMKFSNKVCIKFLFDIFVRDVKDEWKTD